ncbi:Subtilisin inhibitor 1-like protein [Quillaja saponaria]|uniref:Subtilisin inhibitor 1-like protein n=1 Tax=Quillaja saponaria TaxID=32244 RepID=A0AAD7LNI5_QUISA|nr:Subtilisin inhibitor 1-like protein [Quillaja saponaria]
MAEDNHEAKPPQEQPTPSEPSLPRTYNELVASARSDIKRRWPELEGVTVDEAKKKIKEEMPGAEIQVIPPDFAVTCDFRPQRVRLYVDASGKITRTPGLG